MKIYLCIYIYIYISLTAKESKSYHKQKVCCIYKKWFSTDYYNKKYHKVRNRCHYTGKYRGAAYDICNLRYKTPKIIPIVFNNGSTYDCHFTVNELASKQRKVYNFLSGN